MIGSIAAELMILRKRAATWILVGLWTTMAVFFGYVLPYASYRNDARTPQQTPLQELLPERFLATVLGGFPFFGGVLILILGVLTFGSDYGWGTLKTLFTQRPGRLQVFAAKLIALGFILVAFVVTSFAASALASYVIALLEDGAVEWPGALIVLRGMGAAWLIMAVWATLGGVLAILARGTALPIGIGILYGLVIEGLISSLFDEVGLLRPLVKVLLRANAYSLVEPLGISLSGAQDNGPGGFSGPYVGGVQATLVLTLYLVVFAGIAATLLRRRDVA
jgi:ABC-2 type transport system permease protein